MRNPCAVVPGAYLAQLVFSDPLHRLLIGFWIIANWDLRGHSSHSVNAAFVAGMDEQINVRTKEGLFHRDVAALRQYAVRPVPELLDEAEYVIPAAAFQRRGMIAQLVKNLIHLKSGGDGLNQHRRPYGSDGYSEVALRKDEHVVPQPGFKVALQFRKIKVWGRTAIEQDPAIVEQIESEVEQ